MNTDGSIVIGTELSTDKFDKQASELDNKIKKEEQKKIIIEAKMQLQEKDLEETIRKTDELAEAYQKLKSLKEKATAGKMTPRDFEAMQSLQNQYGTLEKIDGLFQKSLSKQDALQLKVQETKNKYESINNEIDKYKQKLAGINIQKQKSDVDQLKGSIDKVGSSFSESVKKAGRLALAIFGIRSAYMMLRRASSELSGYDEQYATNLEYIRFVLTQAVAPILRYIVNLVMQLLGYINAIAQAWFGVNLFANGSVEAFQKMKKGAGGVSKAVKEIKKQLLGFDEVNMLTSQSDTGTQAGASGVGAMPEIDLNAWQGKIPDWLQWIIDHKNEILALLTGIATALLLIKFGMSGIKALGFGLIVTGIVLSVQSLLSYLKNPTWKNFGKIITGIGVIILGFGVIIGGLPAIVAGVITIILGLVVSNWDKIKGKLQEAIDFIESKLDWIQENFGLVGKILTQQLLEVCKFFINSWDNVFTTWKRIFDEIILFVKNVFTGNWNEAWQNIKNIVLILLEALKNHFINIWTLVSNIFANIGSTIKETFAGAWEFVKITFTNTWNWILSLLSRGGQIFNGIKDGIASVFKTIVNSMISGINWAIAQPFNKINNLLNTIKGFSIMGAKPFDGAWGWNPIAVPKIPMLKTGAIINMPNKGTLVGNGSALGGESGKEGIIPLTDQQAMAELGREIGKNVLINLTNITQMNGRVISRELKQVRSTQEFAYNM